MPEGMHTIVMITLGLLAVCLVIAVFMRITRVIITLALLLLIVPIICTVLWGNGDSYVSKFASLFTSDIEQNINDSYHYYREQNEKDPVVDMDQLTEYIDRAKDLFTPDK